MALHNARQTRTTRAGVPRMLGYAVASGVVSALGVHLLWGIHWAPGVVFGIAVMLPFRRVIADWLSHTYGAVLLSGGLYFGAALVVGNARFDSLTGRLVCISLVSLCASGILGVGISALLGARVTGSTTLRFAFAGALAGLLFGLMTLLLPADTPDWTRSILAFTAWQCCVAVPVALLEVPHPKD